MNKTEQEYGAILRARQLTGDILWYVYEGVTLKLADDTRYTPDFFVMLADGTLEAHEVKGPYIREDAWQKLKIAASLFPFVFRLCQNTKDGWNEKVV